MIHLSLSRGRVSLINWVSIWVKNTGSRRDTWKEEGWTRRTAGVRGRIQSGTWQVSPTHSSKDSGDMMVALWAQGRWGRCLRPGGSWRQGPRHLVPLCEHFVWWSPRCWRAKEWDRWAIRRLFLQIRIPELVGWPWSESAMVVAWWGRYSRSHEAKIIFLNVWVTQNIVSFGESREDFESGDLVLNVWKDWFGSKGQWGDLEGQRHFEREIWWGMWKTKTKTQGSDFRSFRVCTFPVPSALLGVLLTSIKCVLNEWTNFSERKERVWEWNNRGRELAVSS